MRMILRRAAQSRLLPLILLVTALTASIDARRMLPLQVTPDNGFPMRPGASWIYRGTVKWTEANSSNVREQSLDWKMEVVRTVLVGNYEIAVMKGDPADLIWYETGKQRGDYLIVRDGGKYYRVFAGTGEDVNALISDLDSHLNLESLFLDLPLHQGMCFGRDPEEKRDDVLYCWSVAQPTTGLIKNVRGIPSNKQFTTFTVSYRANTDHTYVDFVPGIGITSFLFGHHGTVSEVAVKLVEYHPGA